MEITRVMISCSIRVHMEVRIYEDGDGGDIQDAVIVAVLMHGNLQGMIILYLVMIDTATVITDNRMLCTQKIFSNPRLDKNGGVVNYI